MSGIKNSSRTPFIQSEMIGRFDGAVERACASVSTWLTTRLVTAIGSVIALYVLVALIYPLDLKHLIDGDSLYPVQMIQFGILDYRPPPPNRILPDVAVHWLIAPWVTDPLTAKLIAGGILFATTLLAVAVFKSPGVLIVTAALMAWPGFLGLNSATHFTVPLLILAAQLASKNPRLDAPVFALAAFTNILAALPLAVMLFDGHHPQRTLARAAAIIVGIVAAALYSDFGEAFLQLAMILPIWVTAFAVAQRLNCTTSLALVAAFVFILLSVGGQLPVRYTVPVTASLLIALTPVALQSFDWRRLSMPFVLLAVMLTTANASNARQIQQDFASVVQELNRRGIDVIATDHWTSKPLYFAAQASGVSLSITQTNFESNSVHPWMAPYDFAGTPTRWALKSQHSCDGPAHNLPRYCAQERAGEVESRTELSGGFTLFEYREPVPHNHQPRPSSKLQAIARQFEDYLGKALARLGFVAEPAALEADR